MWTGIACFLVSDDVTQSGFDGSRTGTWSNGGGLCCGSGGDPPFDIFKIDLSIWMHPVGSVNGADVSDSVNPVIACQFGGEDQLLRVSIRG